MKSCSMTRLASALSITNGPEPATVLQMARLDAMNVTVAVPRWPRRSAAQITNGKTVYCRGYPSSPSPSQPANTTRLTATSAPHRAAASATPPRSPRSGDALAHTSSSGAMTRSPIASPIHQSDQSAPKADQGWTPPTQRLVTPIVALTVVLTPAAKTIRPRTSRSRSSELRRLGFRSSLERSEEHTSELQLRLHIVC